MSDLDSLKSLGVGEKRLAKKGYSLAVEGDAVIIRDADGGYITGYEFGEFFGPGFLKKVASGKAPANKIAIARSDIRSLISFSLSKSVHRAY